MKKNNLLLIFIFISLISFSQEEVIWLPDDGQVYGDRIQIINPNNNDEDLIENQFIGFDEGDITQIPGYRLNGFESAEEYVHFEWQENNVMYVSQLTYPGLFAEKDVNTIVVSYNTIDAGMQTDTARYYYSGPVIECLEVNSLPYEENMLLDNPETCSVRLRVYTSMYPAVADKGDDKIAGIYQVLGETTFRDIPDTRYADTTLDIDISGLSYGLHYLELYAYGNKEDNQYPDEFSEKIKIRILVFDFEIEGDDDFAVCKCDSLYFLAGLPEAEGGIFSGECVVESSNVFNPRLTQDQSTPIIYRYPVDGIYYEITRTINFHSLPEISLDVQTLAGFDHEVCGFEHGAVYEVMGSGYSTLTWDLPDYIIKQKFFEGDSKVIIDWAEAGDGLITMTATSDEGCKSSLEHMVHISQNQAPEDSAYVTVYDKMLFCSTDVAVYYWYKNDDFLERTDKPYYVLTDKPVAGDSFYVWAAEDTLGCRTHSFVYTIPQEGKSQTNLGDQDNMLVKIFPNPANDLVNCEFLRPVSKGVLTVSDVYGKVVDEFEYHDIYTGEIIRLHTREYPRGVYFLNFSMDDKPGSIKLILY